MSDAKHSKGFQKEARRRISLQVTAVVLVMMLLFSLAIFISFRNSLNNMTENGKEKIIDTVATVVSSSNLFNSNLLRDIQSQETLPLTSSEFFEEVVEAIPQETLTETQQFANDILKKSVDSGSLGIEASVYALPPAPGTKDKPVIVMSSDDEYQYSEIPDEITAIAVESDDNYRLLKDGIPGMGMEGPYLVNTFKLNGEGQGDFLYYINLKPMGELLDAVDTFFRNETRHVYTVLVIVLGLSILLLILISFFVMGSLLNRRLARPIEELSTAAEQVMEGDLDVQVEIKPREEFSQLKLAFNRMVSKLSEIVTMSTEGEAGAVNIQDEVPAGMKTEAGKGLRPRSTLLIQIVSMISIVFILAGTASVLVINRSISNMVENTKEEVIDTRAELTMSAHEFGLELLTLVSPLLSANPAGQEEVFNEFMDAVMNKTVSSLQAESNKLLKSMVDSGLLGIELLCDLVPPNPLMSSNYMVLMSSDLDYLYTEPPDEVAELLDKGEDSYELYEDGFPELGFNEATLVTTYEFGGEVAAGGTTQESVLWSVDYTPMGGEIAGIDKFFGDESNRLNVTTIIIIAVYVLAVILITGFITGYLIRRKILLPIDDLVDAAREVTAGNLDVQVEVRRGDDLENLKTAFNEMIKSLRDIVKKSAGGS
ncbi:MAG: HAMP domain-containing protein [Actinobacteria bacterium]|nr:HAMP domain-containing protein [Actinomycetota bacterium]